MGLRNFFDRIEPNFLHGGKYEKYFPIYEMVESFLYTPKTVTTMAPHARAYIDMKTDHDLCGHRDDPLHFDGDV